MGSGAIGGVINFIVRQDYVGAEVNVNFGVPTRGGGGAQEHAIRQDSQNLDGSYTGFVSNANGPCRIAPTPCGMLRAPCCNLFPIPRLP